MTTTNQEEVERALAVARRLEALALRPGDRFSRQDTPQYRVSPARVVSEAEALPAALGEHLRAALREPLGGKGSVAEAIALTDGGRLELLVLITPSGEALQAVTYHLGDTLCGFITDDEGLVARVEDGELRLP